MKQIIICALISALLSSCAGHRQIKKPFYYLAEAKGQKLLILGTLHQQFSLSDFPTQILGDIESSDLVMLEADHANHSSFYRKVEEMETRYILENSLKPYPQLLKRLSQKAWWNLSFTLNSDEAKKAIAEIKVKHPIHQFNPSLIIYLTQELANQNSIQSFTSEVFTNFSVMSQGNLLFDSDYHLDNEIEAYAEKLKIPVLGLDYELDILPLLKNKMLSPERDFINRIEAIYGETEGIESITKMKNIYREGNEVEMCRLMSVKDYSDEVLKDRNLRWREKIKDHSDRKIFVAVGLAHLLAKDNLLDLLKEDGFVITRTQLQE